MQLKLIILPVVIFFMVVVAAVPYSYSRQSADVDPSIRITDVAICRGVIDRKPIETGDIFSADIKKLFCFSRVTGALGETEVVHDWYYGGKRVSRSRLPVKSGNWRTYSSKTIPPGAIGEWKVEILSREGTLLKQIYFAVN